MMESPRGCMWFTSSQEAKGRVQWCGMMAVRRERARDTLAL